MVSLETRISYLGDGIQRNTTFSPLCVLHRVCAQGPAAHKAVHTARSNEFGFFSLKHALSKGIPSAPSYKGTFHLDVALAVYKWE